MSKLADEMNNNLRLGRIITMKRLLLLAFILFLVIFSNKQPALAAPFYEGRVMRMIVGHEVGGGYDRITRLIAKHITKARLPRKR